MTGLLLVVLLAGCRVAAPTPVDDLQPVHWPVMARLVDEGIRNQLAIQRQHLESLLSEPDTPPDVLGRGYGFAAMTMMAYDHFEEARPAMANALALQPDEPRWTYLLAYIDLELGDEARAEDGFRRMLELMPEDLPTRVHLAEIAHARGRTEAAREMLETILEQAPKNAAVLALLGDLAAEREDLPTAIAYYLLALQAQPGANRVHAKLAPLYQAAGNEDEARRHAEASGEIPPQLSDPWVAEFRRLNQSPLYYVDQGVRFVDAGRVDEAAQHFERALELDPEHVLALTNLALARSSLGDLDAALEIGQRAIDAGKARRDGQDAAGLDTEIRAHLQMASFLMADGRPGEAEGRIRDALELDPDRSQTRNELARHLRRDGRCDEAVEHYRISLELEPPQPALLWVEMALCLSALGRDDEALARLDEAQARRPDSIELLDARARLLAASPDDALRDGQTALTLATRAYEMSQGVDVLESLAMAHAELGQFEQAIEWQQQAIDLAVEQERDAWRESLEQALEAYRAGRPSRQPWPDFLRSR